MINDTTTPKETNATKQETGGGWIRRLVVHLRSKTPKAEPAPDPVPWWHESWERLMKEYPRGRKFEYLGRQMIVIRYRHWNPEFSGGMGCPIYIPPTYPAMVSQYADETGKIRDHEWDSYSWMILLDNE